MKQQWPVHERVMAKTNAVVQVVAVRGMQAFIVTHGARTNVIHAHDEGDKYQCYPGDLLPIQTEI